MYLLPLFSICSFLAVNILSYVPSLYLTIVIFNFFLLLLHWICWISFRQVQSASLQLSYPHSREVLSCYSLFVDSRRNLLHPTAWFQIFRGDIFILQSSLDFHSVPYMEDGFLFHLISCWSLLRHVRLSGRSYWNFCSAPVAVLTTWMDKCHLLVILNQWLIEWRFFNR